MTEATAQEEFNTEFPPHSATVGRLPEGHPGMSGQNQPFSGAGAVSGSSESGNEGSDNGSDSSESSKSGDGGSGGPDIPHPDSLDSTGDGVQDDHGNIAPPPSIASWAARIATLGTLAGIIGYLLYLCLRPAIPAQFDLLADFDALSQRNGSWVLPIEVTNTSTESMGSVLVEVESGDLTREFSLTLMGEGETGFAEVLFDTRPVAGATTVRVLSYVSP